ncbi:hypothetical protein [Frigidibacter oleivorans]|uniref:hypothetical protein n=1 Tax=Frigidibacter oleivorans TaxID=2487129 RepID=UPI000F8DC8DB|nr:hypothetical protein [Frigidibacter oleivorans]
MHRDGNDGLIGQGDAITGNHAAPRNAHQQMAYEWQRQDMRRRAQGGGGNRGAGGLVAILVLGGGFLAVTQVAGFVGRNSGALMLGGVVLALVVWPVMGALIDRQPGGPGFGARLLRRAGRSLLFAAVLALTLFAAALASQMLGHVAGSGRWRMADADARVWMLTLAVVVAVTAVLSRLGGRLLAGRRGGMLAPVVALVAVALIGAGLSDRPDGAGQMIVDVLPFLPPPG